jgi:hypothetical protein
MRVIVPPAPSQQKAALADALVEKIGKIDKTDAGASIGT